MTLPAPNQRSVLIVDDSAFMRKVIAEMVSSDPGFTVIGFARHGIDALQQLERLDPDLITLDLEMPQLDGLQVLGQIMAHAPKPVVVLSAGGQQWGDATVRALEMGAVDFVKKPSGAISLDLHAVRDRLLEALRTASNIDITKLHRIDPAVRQNTVTSPSNPAASHHPRRLHQPIVPAKCVVVIASSTGGPQALAECIPALPEDLPAAVLIAQHMPREFTLSLARRLDQASRMRVTEGIDGEPILEGRVYIAPGRTHLRIVGTAGSATVAIDEHPIGATVAPSADELFTSAAHSFGPSVIGVVLTGMGRDGTKGAKAIRDAQGYVLVQDRATSVIYGMPHAALTGAGADQVVPLGDIAVAVVRAVAEQRSTILRGHVEKREAHA
ncbi:MAG TPA: chemotaxis-specific protein-glutamate methyltransferase CheB [Gemmatimonadaceae bacterium]|nr:chemotaxis-specific protein-glutamate methyltransferase CheB [Gemmatimonadaceae bacterium]